MYKLHHHSVQTTPPIPLHLNLNQHTIFSVHKLTFYTQTKLYMRCQHHHFFHPLHYFVLLLHYFIVIIPFISHDQHHDPISQDAILIVVDNNYIIQHCQICIQTYITYTCCLSLVGTTSTRYRFGQEYAKLLSSALSITLITSLSSSPFLWHAEYKSVQYFYSLVLRFLSSAINRNVLLLSIQYTFLPAAVTAFFYFFTLFRSHYIKPNVSFRIRSDFFRDLCFHDGLFLIDLFSKWTSCF